MTSEEKKAENAIEKAEEAGKDSGDGDKPKADSIVERANDVAERMAKENDRAEANLKRQEELMARETLGGKSDGKSQPEEKQPMTDKEYKDYFLKHGKPPEGEK